MKRIFLIAYTLLSVYSVGVVAQDKALQKAEKNYNSFNYSSAIEKYQESNNKSSKDLRNMGKSLLMAGEYGKAEETYALLIQKSDKSADDLWQYAQVLMMNEKYDKAKEQLKFFASSKTNDKRANIYNEYANADFVNKIKNDPSRFNIKNISVNTDQQDFGAAFYNDKVVFSSSRTGVKPVVRKWNGNQLPFLDLYVADKDNSSELSNVSYFAKKEYNAKFHDGPIGFDKSFTKAVITRNNYTEKASDGTRKLEMFYSTYGSGKWADAVPFEFNSKEYSTGHGTFTPDGNTVYFASDMPGGLGGVDIYKTTRAANGSWSKPQNISEINTEADEMFPYYHESGILFFSSNGYAGLGGLDVFYTQVKNDNVSKKVQNAGYPLNGSKDDFCFVLDAEMKKGYFSSNREGGKGNDDIYSFDLLKPFKFGKIIKGVTKDKNGIIIPNAIVVLKDDKGVIVETVKSNEKGEYSFSVEKDLIYALNGKQEKYFDGNNTADATVDKDEIISDLILEKDPGMSLYLLVLDKATKTPLTDVKVTLVNNLDGTEQAINTPATGDYLKSLLDKKINDRVSYNIKLEKQGYLSKIVTYNKLLDKEGRYDVHSELDIAMDKIDVGLDLAKIIDIKPIYFDLSKWNIRKDAALELDKIIKVMNENPEMVIELGSHTDCRSSASFNMNLSDKRAKASAEYIKKKITRPERIYGKGYGESILVNGCACEGAVKSSCSEEEHQKNRRTEFKIIKIN